MPKRAKPDDDKVTVLPTLANSDGAKLRGFLDRIHVCQDDIDAQMAEARQQCAPYRDDIKVIKREAAEAGFARKEFNTVVRKERAERRLARIAENLDDEQTQRYEAMLHALGQLADTPLGQAARP